VSRQSLLHNFPPLFMPLNGFTVNVNMWLYCQDVEQKKSGNFFFLEDWRLTVVRAWSTGYAVCFMLRAT